MIPSRRRTRSYRDPYFCACSKFSTISFSPFTSLVAFSLSFFASSPSISSFLPLNQQHARTHMDERLRDERYDQISERAKTFETPALLESRRALLGLFRPSASASGPSTPLSPRMVAMPDIWFPRAAFFMRYDYYSSSSFSSSHEVCHCHSHATHKTRPHSFRVSQPKVPF